MPPRRKRMQKTFVCIPFQNNRGKYYIHTGELIKPTTNTEFTVKWLDKTESTHPISKLKDYVLPKVNDIIAYRNGTPGKHAIYVGRVTRIYPNTQFFNREAFECYWGDPVALKRDYNWLPSEFGKEGAIKKYIPRGGKRIPFNSFYKIQTDDPLFAIRTDLQIFNFNKQVGEEISPRFPVDVFMFLKKLFMVSDSFSLDVTAASVVSRFNAAKAGFAAVGAFQYVGQYADRFNNVAVADADQAYTNLILRGIKHSVGWKTINSKLTLLDQKGEKQQYGPMRDAMTVQSLRQGDIEAKTRTLRQFYADVKLDKSSAVPTMIPPDDLFGKLQNSKLLQGLELNTMSSFLGSRIHQKMLLTYAASFKNENAAPVLAPYNPNPDTENPYTINSEVFQMVFASLFDKQVQIIDSVSSLEPLVNMMTSSLSKGLTKFGITPVACEVPVFCGLRTFDHAEKQYTMESRVDFIGTDLNGKIILGDYKSHLGNGVQFELVKESNQLKQIITYAFLLLQNYHILVDTVAIVYVNRRGDVHMCTLPFKEKLIGVRERLSPAKRAIKQLLTSWINISGTVCDQHIVTVKNNVPTELLTEFKYLKYWESGGVNPLKRLSLEDLAYAIKFHKFFKQGVNSGVRRIENKRIIFNNLSLWHINQQVYTFEDVRTVPGLELNNARFFHSEIINPLIITRKYGPQFTSKVDKRIVTETERKAFNRNTFNAYIYEQSSELKERAKKSNGLKYTGTQLQALFPRLTYKVKPVGTSAESWRQVVCVRALQVEVNQMMINYLQQQNVIDSSDPSAFNKGIDEQVENYPLAMGRFATFTHMSQRPAWSNEMYLYAADNFIEKALDTLVAIFE